MSGDAEEMRGRHHGRDRLVTTNTIHSKAPKWRFGTASRFSTKPAKREGEEKKGVPGPGAYETHLVPKNKPSSQNWKFGTEAQRTRNFTTTGPAPGSYSPKHTLTKPGMPQFS